jgi:hypothetical protein
MAASAKKVPPPLSEIVQWVELPREAFERLIGGEWGAVWVEAISHEWDRGRTHRGSINRARKGYATVYEWAGRVAVCSQEW